MEHTATDTTAPRMIRRTPGTSPPASDTATRAAGSGPVPKRTRAPRSDRGQLRLTERDVSVLLWIGEMYAVRIDQLQRLLGRLSRHETQRDALVASKTAERVVARWQKGGLVERDKFLYGEPAWVWLSRKGLQQFELDYRYRPPSVAGLQHRYWTNQVRLFVERRRPEVVWIGERRLRAQHPDYGVETNQGQHCPDAEIVLEEARIALEVELTQKRASDLLDILYALGGGYGTVWYFTNAETRGPVERGIASLPPHLGRKFRIHNLEETR